MVHLGSLQSGWTYFKVTLKGFLSTSHLLQAGWYQGTPMTDIASHVLLTSILPNSYEITGKRHRKEETLWCKCKRNEGRKGRTKLNTPNSRLKQRICWYTTKRTGEYRAGVDDEGIVSWVGRWSWADWKWNQFWKGWVANSRSNRSYSIRVE